MSRMYRSHQPAYQDHVEAPVDPENQFILRLPSEPAHALREAIRSGGANLRDRMSIKMEPDKTVSNQSQLRRGVVKFENFELTAKLVDLPTIIESQKTIDRKTFYKTADICQMLICKEGDPSDDEDPAKKQLPPPNKDPNKVDKKFIYPHGVTLPLKNCRKRRFRKVLRKNFVEAPEIEKEVRHLLRVDNEAVDVKWELITEGGLNAGKSTENATTVPNLSNMGNTSTAVDERDLFGALSDSDEDVEENIDIDSEGDMDDTLNSSGSALATEFNKDMFQSANQSMEQDEASQDVPSGSGQDAVAVQLDKLRSEIGMLQRQKEELEQNIANCDNQALLHRFRESLCKVETDIRTREMDIESFSVFN